MNYPNFVPQQPQMGSGNNYGMNNNPYANIAFNTNPQQSTNTNPYATMAPIPSISQPQNNFCGINGKFVESKEIVGITEIPGGGYGVFPRADLQEIYFKTWNKNGLTDIITYVPKIEENTQKEPSTMQVYGALEEHIKRLESKLDSIVSSFQKPINEEEQNSPQKEIKF